MPPIVRDSRIKYEVFILSEGVTFSLRLQVPPSLNAKRLVILE